MLITERDLRDAPLPVGRLRELPSSLERASALVFIGNASDDGIPVRKGQLVWRATRGIVSPESKEPCFAFCGIARPENFFAELGEAGVNVTGTRSFRDHHAYSAQDVEALYRQGQQSGATAFVTTEKDAVNLGEYTGRLRPLHVVAVKMEFEPGSESAVETVWAVMRGANQGA